VLAAFIPAFQACPSSCSPRIRQLSQGLGAPSSRRQATTWRIGITKQDDSLDKGLKNIEKDGEKFFERSE
jgi:hypothetical protein